MGQPCAGDHLAVADIDNHHTIRTTAMQQQRQTIAGGGNLGDAGARRLVQRSRASGGGRVEAADEGDAEHHHTGDNHHAHHNSQNRQRPHEPSPFGKPLPDRHKSSYAGRMSSQSSAQASPELNHAPAPQRALATAEQAGERVDRFLAEQFPEHSRSRVKQFIEEGRVTRDGAPLTQPAEAVRGGAEYVIALPAPVAARPVAQDIPFPILYEDRDLIVLDKPAGLVVHPAPGNEDGTLVNALLAHCGNDLPGIGGEKRPGIVHRLDKDTSGTMVVAKSELALKALQEMFVARDLERSYLALCWGILNPLSGEFDGAIGRDKKDRKRMAVVDRGGKQALTRYKTLATYEGAVSLIEGRLATGRTHQIRVHLSQAGHPIIGDPVYLRRIPAAARALPVALREQLLDFPRQALHAARLGFRHPRSGAELLFETPPPADMATLLAALNMAQS